MRIRVFAAFAAILLAKLTFAAPAQEIVTSTNGDRQSLVLANRSVTAAIVVDSRDYPVVTLAANLLADDVNRVSGHRPVVSNRPDTKQVVIAGTFGHSTLIDTLAGSGKLKDLDRIKGGWEATLSQIVETPFPGVARALVIVGSDRRGTAYGLMRLSENIGVSPWYWWADVPAKHQDELQVKFSSPQVDM